MIFDPARVHKSVLEFYLSSGLLGYSDSLITFTPPTPLSVYGNSQAYEQINLFLYGHLLPDYAPLEIQFTPLGSQLATKYLLPETSLQACYHLFEELSENFRLHKLNVNSAARLRTSIDPPSLVLDFPLDLANMEAPQQSIDLVELKKRYDTLDTAAQMFNGFFANAYRHLDLLTHAMDQGDWTEVHRHVHALKGGALNLTAQDLASLCIRFEAAVKHGQTKDLQHFIPQINNALTDLEKAYETHKEAFLA